MDAKQKEKDALKVNVYRDWCKSCGICSAFCPTGAITRDEAGYPQVDPEKCITCGMCEMRCPDFAISVEKKHEEAQKLRGSFEKKGPEGTVTSGE